MHSISIPKQNQTCQRLSLENPQESIPKTDFLVKEQDLWQHLPEEKLCGFAHGEAPRLHAVHHPLHVVHVLHQLVSHLVHLTAIII